MGSTTVRSLDREPAALAMRIGVVAAEAALATFARNLDLDDLADGVDFQGAIGPAEWLAAKGYLPPTAEPVVVYFYTPIDWVSDAIPSFRNFINWYIELFFQFEE